MFKQKSIIIPELDLMDLDEYLDSKKLQTIIFNDNILSKIETPECREYIESDIFMTNLTDFVAINYINQIADVNIKNNIFEVLDYLRKNKNYNTFTEKKQVYADINELISTLNLAKDEGCISFYRNQHYNRSDQKRSDYFDFAYNEKYIEKRKESLNYSIISDYPIICDFLYEEDEELFADEVVPDNLLSHYFINTLNILFTEMPSLYNNKRFIARSMYVLRNNILLSKGKKSDYDLIGTVMSDADVVPRSEKVLNKFKRISR